MLNFTHSFTRITSLFCWIALLIVVHTIIVQYSTISIFSPQRNTTPTAVTINHHINDNATPFLNVVFLGALQVRLTAGLAVNLTVGANAEPISILNGTTSITGYSPFLLQINHCLLYNIS